MNKSKILYPLDDQFQSLNSESTEQIGFNVVSTRKKPGGSSTQYQYKIGQNASLIISSKEYISKLQPKPAGEWIDIAYNNKDIYLYLECQLYVKARSPETNLPTQYAASSAKLITTDSSLPTNFSGTFVKKNDKYGLNYYETTLSRKFLAILNFSIDPVMFCNSYNLTLTNYNSNGINRDRIL